MALFRYKLIAEAANPRLSPAERGQLVRELASQPVELTDGRLHQFARGTFDRWLRAYREQGLAGLKPEVLAVEADRLVDVIHDVADADSGHVVLLARPPRR